MGIMRCLASAVQFIVCWLFMISICCEKQIGQTSPIAQFEVVNVDSFGLDASWFSSIHKYPRNCVVFFHW